MKPPATFPHQKPANDIQFCTSWLSMSRSH